MSLTPRLPFLTRPDTLVLSSLKPNSTRNAAAWCLLGTAQSPEFGVETVMATQRQQSKDR